MQLKPITHIALRTELRTGIVTFAFKKLDGTLRTAVGTTVLSLIPEANWPTGRRESSPNAVGVNCYIYITNLITNLIKTKKLCG
jgi:hypothetical protein